MFRKLCCKLQILHSENGWSWTQLCNRCTAHVQQTLILQKEWENFQNQSTQCALLLWLANGLAICWRQKTTPTYRSRLDLVFPSWFSGSPYHIVSLLWLSYDVTELAGRLWTPTVKWAQTQCCFWQLETTFQALWRSPNTFESTHVTIFIYFYSFHLDTEYIKGWSSPKWTE